MTSIPTQVLSRTVWYDPAQRREEFVALLDHVLTWMQTEKVRATLGSELHQQVQTEIGEVAARLKTDFTLVVLGDFKRGKSTLINALLGMPVVTTDVTPETVTINEIRYGAALSVQACLVNGGRVRLKHKELKAERLAPLLKQLPDQVSHLKIEAPVEWLEQICLVDTPGTGDLEWRFDKQVQSYLPKADAVLVVVSALSPLSKTERAFLQLALSPLDFPKLFFVVNMMDIPRKERDAKRLLEALKIKIGQYFPEAPVFGISALDEFCRLQELPRPTRKRGAFLAQAFAEFRTNLAESILLNRDMIQLDRAFAQLEQVLREVETDVNRVQRSLEIDHKGLELAIRACEDEKSDLYQQIEQHQQQIKRRLEALSEQACGWLDEFLDRIAEEVIPSLSTVKLPDLQRHFPFFLTDSLSTAVNHCLEAHHALIMKSLNDAKTAIFADINQLADLSQSNISRSVSEVSFANSAWTNLDTIQFLLDSTLGGVFNIAADLLMSQTKKIAQQQQVTTYQQKLLEGLPALRHSVRVELQALYFRLASSLEQQLANAYQHEIKGALAAMRQAQELQNAGEKKITLAHSNLQEVRHLLSDSLTAVGALQEKLWPKELQALS